MVGFMNFLSSCKYTQFTCSSPIFTCFQVRFRTISKRKNIHVLIFIYLKCRETEIETDTGRSPICWFTHQLPAVAWVGPGWCQALGYSARRWGTQPGAGVSLVVDKIPGIWATACCFPGWALAGAAWKAEPGLKPSHSDMRCRCLKLLCLSPLPPVTF